jgi:hypothetical protein
VSEVRWGELLWSSCLTITEQSKKESLKMADVRMIKLFREGVDSTEVDYDASNIANVAALKTATEMLGKTCSVNGIVCSNDNLPLNDGDRVIFTGGNKTGGNVTYIIKK